MGFKANFSGERLVRMYGLMVDALVFCRYVGPFQVQHCSLPGLHPLRAHTHTYTLRGEWNPDSHPKPYAIPNPYLHPCPT